jgi:hypothetical protein
VGEEVFHFLHFPLASHERSQLYRQVVGQVVEGLQQWEVGRQARSDHLENALGTLKVFEAVFPQIAQSDIFG